ncbi:MAG: hypothetical protein KJ995_01045 [Candidatus Omnitrophica bacterium]|nr:hypothetical protein [Candidatus Omnitrophota bacterium]MBU1128700.1 hypothetical protein [Candidatus Omnitrophota bacterium]MBU1850977.1 hypothetical protein [Candidatus Omnitrophota bacterium]
MAKLRSKGPDKAKKKVLLGVTASIAAYKACDIINELRKRGFRVKCAMSKDAKEFIQPLVLETLSGQKTAKDLFHLPEERTPEHISLAEEADIILVAPATADIIGKVAAGISDDILTCAICAAKGPVVFAPAMNNRMFENPILQDKISYLKEKGYYFIEPVVGHLACGRNGVGHLAPLEDIIRRVEDLTK